MHAQIAELRKRLTAARDTYGNAQAHAQTALRALVGDGSGDKALLSEARAVANDFDFDMVLNAPLPEPKPEPEAPKTPKAPKAPKAPKTPKK